MKLKLFVLAFISCQLVIFVRINAQSLNNDLKDKLEINFKGDAQVEVGNAYVGVEMHHSSILPERISFYYPVANSIDLSTDYFHRDTTYIMKLGLKIGNGKKEWLGIKPYKFNLTPYEVTYKSRDEKKSIVVSYRFCKEYPAMVVTYEITNNTGVNNEFEFYTHLETSLHTSHTYALKDKAETYYDSAVGGIYASFDDKETQDARVFVINAGEKPYSFSTDGNLSYSAEPRADYWFNHNGKLPEKVYRKENRGIPAAEFLYKKELKPSGKMIITQIIGQCKKNEIKKLSKELVQNYKASVRNYEQYVLDYVKYGSFNSGDEVIDQSYLWAKAMLAVDKHYIDGEIRPMPCPAEYNFYFTHDVLLTDLAAVNFDLGRVKNDLEYTIDHANKDKVIPHAYYWKDSSYVTEDAVSDNWNHFWFIIVSASYLRHSGDITMLKKLYPYITESLKLSLTNMKDSLMWASRPDWWDIGKNYGPRVYTTALEIKALNDYNYISSEIKENSENLAANELLAKKMKNKLNDFFWSHKFGYLMNYLSDGSVDPHYYIGSFVAAYLNYLNDDKISELVNTARNKMLDQKVGVYNAFPMDFEKLKNFWHFADDEQGQPFLYMNGGIWPHGNAWYSLALISAGKRKEALKFIKNVMTVKGIMSGPNGQPAMYEVRNGDYHDSSVYGKIDKPEFMWAAAWYINSIYNLFGIHENSWNIGLSPYLYNDQKQCGFTLTSGGNVFNVKTSGKGKFIEYVKLDGKIYPSAVLPADVKELKNVEVKMGDPVIPYVSGTNSILRNAEYSSKDGVLNIILKSFSRHQIETSVISREKPKSVSIDGIDANNNFSCIKDGGIYKIHINSKSENEEENLKIKF